MAIPETKLSSFDSARADAGLAIGLKTPPERYLRRTAPWPSNRSREINLLSRILYQLAGVAAAVLLWGLFTSRIFLNEQFSHGFSPLSTVRALVSLIHTGELNQHLFPSLLRVGVGLGIACAVGVPLGTLVGYFTRLNLLTHIVFQFVRMTSPLAWMPIAIIMLGVGNKPVYFLIAIAAVWPIVISTSFGVRNVNPDWIEVVRTLGGGRWQILRRAVLPSIVPDILTGLRIALGISWVILVPGEMLGVSNGLGYFILDARDRFAYDELMATILVIGFLGMVTDSLLRWLERRFSWRSEKERPMAK